MNVFQSNLKGLFYNELWFDFKLVFSETSALKVIYF